MLDLLEGMIRIGTLAILLAPRSISTPPFPPNLQPSRKRPLIALWIVISIVLGLASRRWTGSSVTFVTVHAGDVLWATCLYFALALCFPRSRERNLFAATILISFLVELSQAWHPAWLDEFRRNTFAQLLLGTGWQWQDLPRYFVGALLAWALDRNGALGRRAQNS